MSSLIGFNENSALPGHKVGFKDKQVKLPRDSSPAKTESIVLIGTATDGPVNTPVKVDTDNVYSIFGTSTHENGVPNGATLVNGFEEAWQSGCRDIRLMRYSGQESVAVIEATSFVDTDTNVHVEEFVAPGNAETTFTLKHGGILPVTVEIEINEDYLSTTDYTLDPGIAGDETGTGETKATLTVHENVANMLSTIRVSYRYEYIDSITTDIETVDVLGENTDDADAVLQLGGKVVTETLAYQPRMGSKLYINGVEVVDTDVFEVTGKTLTVQPTGGLTKGAHLKLSYTYSTSETITPKINLRSIYGGSKYNDAKVEVKNDNGIVSVIIQKPASKKTLMSEAAMKVRSVEFPTLQLLVDAINSHPLNNCIEASIDTEFANVGTDTLLVKSETNFTGGSDELNLSRQDIYERLGGTKDKDGYVVIQGAYQMLENYTVDYVVPLGVYADEKLTGIYDNFAYQLALACAVMSHYNSVTMGYISTTSPTSTSLRHVEDHVRKLEALDNLFYMRNVMGDVIIDGEGTQIDLGQFIAIDAGPEVVTPNTRSGYVANNSPTSVASTITALDIRSAATNKKIKAASGLRFEYSAPQLNRLTAARYVTKKRKSNGDVVIVDAVTAAAADSDYTRVATARVVKEVANQVREVADPYIGEPNDVPNRNALAASLDKRLSKLVEAGIILGYRFDIIATAQMELIGQAQIELSIKVANELRDITTVVGLSA